MGHFQFLQRTALGVVLMIRKGVIGQVMLA